MADLIASCARSPRRAPWSFTRTARVATAAYYYDSQPLAIVRHPQTMLAYDMNFAPLTELHGAPLRLRVENQLGFKMVKWISAIEFVEDVKRISKGEGGYDEDNEFFNSMADI